MYTLFTRKIHEISCLKNEFWGENKNFHENRFHLFNLSKFPKNDDFQDEKHKNSGKTSIFSIFTKIHYVYIRSKNFMPKIFNFLEILAGPDFSKMRRTRISSKLIWGPWNPGNRVFSGFGVVFWPFSPLYTPIGAYFPGR